MLSPLDTHYSLKLSPGLAQVLLLIQKGTWNIRSLVIWSLVFASLLCSEIGGIVWRERWVVKGLLPQGQGLGWRGAWLEMMLHLHFLGLELSTPPSEAMALDAVVPTCMCCVHVTENRGGSTVPNRLASSCTRFSKKQPQTRTSESHPALGLALVRVWGIICLLVSGQSHSAAVSRKCFLRLGKGKVAPSDECCCAVWLCGYSVSTV